MNTKLTSLVTAPYILLARSFVVILGCIAVWWGIIGFPIFWQDSSIERIATQIIAGNPFKVETLTQQLPIIDSIKSSAYCRPAALRSATIIQLRMLEVAASANDRQHLDELKSLGNMIRSSLSCAPADPLLWLALYSLEVAASANDRQHLDEYLKSLGNAIRSSLSCTPADPFLWLALYSVEVTENGFKPDYLKYLRVSYRLGPHEGWIALKRNPLAFAAFQQLPPDLGENAINEFVALLESGLSDQAAEIIIGPAWPERELILSHLTRLSDYERQSFADALHRRGYDLNVPGIGLAPRDSHRFAPEIRVPQ